MHRHPGFPSGWLSINGDCKTRIGLILKGRKEYTTLKSELEDNYESVFFYFLLPDKASNAS
jgi:hypothetical protein